MAYIQNRLEECDEITKKPVGNARTVVLQNSILLSYIW